jgi:fucose permease
MSSPSTTAPAESAPDKTAAARRNTAFFLIAISFLGFISLGLPDGLLSVAWPSIRAAFALPVDSLGALLVAAMIGYMLSSFNSGRFIAWLGIGRLLALSCAVTGCSLIGYTLVPAWPLMVVIGVFLGAGGGAIDAGLNTYVASNHGPGLMQWLHASFGVGTTLGPLIMTAALRTEPGWRLGYMIVGVAQLALALTFLLTARLWADGARQHADADADLLAHKTPVVRSLRMPVVQLSALLFFVYAGVEATAGQWAYTLLLEGRGMDKTAAGLWVSAYWGSFTIGRIVSGVAARYLPTTRLIRLGMAGAIIGAGLFWLNPVPIVGLLGLALTGFAIAPIFAAMISTTAGRVGNEHAANTIGFQISMCGLGIALMPGLTGILARNFGLEVIGLSVFASALVIFVLHEIIMRLRRA